MLRINHAATFEADDFESGIGQFHCDDRAANAGADNNRIDGFKFDCAHASFSLDDSYGGVVAGWPCYGMLTALPSSDACRSASMK